MPSETETIKPTITSTHPPTAPVPFAVNFFPQPANSEVNPQAIQRIYAPLGGDELIAAILKHVERELLGCGKILPHLIYESPRWRVQALIDWNATANNEVKFIGANTTGDEVSTPTEASAKVVVEASQLDKDIAPDEIREITGQKIPVMMNAQGKNSTVVNINPNALTGAKGNVKDSKGK